MADDGELLREYVQSRSEAAFAELVRRHLDLVYSAALRQSNGDLHRAKDISQSVFVDLARKASALAGRSTLAGWLYLGTHRAAAKIRRAESRRQAREKVAMSIEAASGSSEPAVEWEKMRPVIDRALLQLSDSDREAVLLRYFEGCAFADIGAKLHLSPDAARMRVDRALEKLRFLLAQRGLSSSAAAPALLLETQAVAATPAGLAVAISHSVLAGTIGTGSLSPLFHLMKLTPSQTGIALAVLFTGTAGLVREIQANQKLKAEVASLRAQTARFPEMQSDHAHLQKVERDLSAEVAQEAARQTTVAARPKPPPAPAPKPRYLSSLTAALAAGPLFEEGQVEQKPVLLGQSRPSFPLEMRKAGLSGKAIIDFVVAVDGGVVDAKVASTTDPAFGDAALKSVAQWIFKPGQQGGLPVNVHMRLPIVFTLNSEE